LLKSASTANPGRHLAVLLAAGLLAGAGQMIVVRFTSGNGIEITEAIWFTAGRLPALRALGSALLSIAIVGMGASLGRERAPKQVGVVIANALSDRAKLSNEQRRLLVACGAGAGLAAAYRVPLGGALFALEVLRGILALRLVLPALLTSLIATIVSWTVLPDAPTYFLPSFQSSASVICKSFMASPQVLYSLRLTRHPSIQFALVLIQRPSQAQAPVNAPIKMGPPCLPAALFERPFRATTDFDFVDPDLIANRAQGRVQQRDLLKCIGRQWPALRSQFFYRRKARRFEAFSKVVNGGGISHRILPYY
jgi:hypothetical protein